MAVPKQSGTLGYNCQNLPKPDCDATHMPSPERIRIECVKIRAGWSATEERSRRGLPANRGEETPYEIPRVPFHVEEVEYD